MGLVQTPPEEFNWDRSRHVLGQGSSPAATQPRSSVIGFRQSHVLINNRATVVRRFPSCRTLTVCWTSSPRPLINNRQTGEFGTVCINISLACIHSQLRVRHKSSGLPILTYSLPSARCSFPSRRC